MSTPKIKVYRLDKGYNPDRDSDIQSSLNSELLPFVKKNQKPTDAYYLSGISDEKVEYNCKKINVQYTELFFNNSVLSVTFNVDDWKKIIKNGYHRCRVVVAGSNSDGEIIYQELGGEKSESLILEKIRSVRGGDENPKSYFSKKDFIYAHPFIFTEENKHYEIISIESEDEVSLTVKILDNDIVLDESVKYYLEYYMVSENSKLCCLNAYPLYDGLNYFYTPVIFVSEKIDLTIVKEGEIFFSNNNIELTDDYIFTGTGSPFVVCNGEVLDKEKYQIQYSFSKEGVRSLVVKISYDFYNENIETEFSLICNKHSDLISSEKYVIDSDIGSINFIEVPESFSIYYRSKVQRSKLFISEHTNWSFGHLRNNPDIFFGEQDYAGDESEDAMTGTPLYNGLKPLFFNRNDYQVDYFRGSVSFHNQEKTVFKSPIELKEDLLNRNENQAESFVRANYSYYPEIHGVYQQKFDLVSSEDGYVYKPIEDKRFGSTEKRWIIKSDEYQPLFFDEFIDGVKVCSQYISTYPNYDKLENKNINILDNNIDKLTFILPLIESEFILLNKSNKSLNKKISFLNDKSEVIEDFELTISSDDELLLNNEVLDLGIEKEVNGTTLNLKIIYLYNECKDDGKKSFSIHLVSVEYNK